VPCNNGRNRKNEAERVTTKKLGARQQKFVEEYLQCLNATQAYLSAYPNSSQKAAEVSALNLADHGCLLILAVKFVSAKVVLGTGARVISLTEFTVLDIIITRVASTPWVI
jgi:hypothetical protein